MVTGLYMKNLNKHHLESNEIESQYQKLLLSNEDDYDKNETIEKEESSPSSADEKENQYSYLEDYYDPHLQPKSTIHYEEKGAKIYDVKITTLDGKKVNVLIQGKEYLYSYKVSAKNKLCNAQFGFLIKRKDGVALGGGLYPSRDQYIEMLSLESKITFKIHCLLNEGEYFFNAGLIAKYDERIDYVARILDVYYIKVLSDVKHITADVNFIKSIQLHEQ